jgi:hypothetical protein
LGFVGVAVAVLGEQHPIGGDHHERVAHDADTTQKRRCRSGSVGVDCLALNFSDGDAARSQALVEGESQRAWTVGPEVTYASGLIADRCRRWKSTRRNL